MNKKILIRTLVMLFFGAFLMFHTFNIHLKEMLNNPGPEIEELECLHAKAGASNAILPPILKTVEAEQTHYTDVTAAPDLSIEEAYPENEAEDAAQTDDEFNINNGIRYEIQENAGFKCYERYQMLRGGKQKELQDMAYTDDLGFRKIDDKYMVAIGTHFNTEVGQVIDLELEDDRAILCIVGDIKADVDTDENNIFTIYNGCCSEFIVDDEAFPEEVKVTGNVSTIPEFSSPVRAITVYDKIY